MANVFEILETALQATRRRLITGVNCSPGIVNPFRELGHLGMSLDTILTRARADTDDEVILVIHIACPRGEYTDRGKSALVTANSARTSTSFTQTLLPDYIAEKRPAWASRVVFDARGHFAEPHADTGKIR